MKINEKQVLEISKIGRATLHRKIAAGLFPMPERPDGWHVFWDETSVLAWRQREDLCEELAKLRRSAGDDAAKHRRVAALLEQLSGDDHA